MNHITKILSVLALISLLVFDTALGGEVWHVDEDFDTIQDAIDSPLVQDGDIIRVGPGYWAGATVSKAVEIEGDHAVINDGPIVPPYTLRAGFLFTSEGDGGGTSIRGFRFEGVQQPGFEDDGYLDMPIFSGSTDNVTVEHNVMVGSLQAISNWNGSGWTIQHNKIDDLWCTPFDGGIGIVIGGSNNRSAIQNVVQYNIIETDYCVLPPQFEAPATYGIVLYSVETGSEIKGNLILHNHSQVIGTPGIEINGIGFGIFVGSGSLEEVTGNTIAFNDFRGSSLEMSFDPVETEDCNTISRNLGQNRGHGEIPAVHRLH
jgi:hypothetical protein